METKLNLKYKGSRNYIHGSDIFMAATNFFLEQNGYIKRLAFKSFARNQLKISFDEPLSNDRALGYGILSSPLGNKKFFLIETGQSVTERYPYDENEVLDGSQIFDAYIENSTPNKYSTIENIIALTKKLNNHLSPEISGKWLFGQLDVKDALPDSWHEIKVTRKTCIADSFSRNLIEIDGQDYGEIRFIVGEP